MLSKNYKIDFYKGTRVKMNYIEVPSIKQWRIPYVFSQPLPDESDDDEGVFEKSKSIFKAFKSDTKVLIKKLVDADLALTKLSKIIKDEQDQKQLEEYLTKVYEKIKNVFINLSTTSSSFPNVGDNEIQKWATNCDFYDQNFVQS